MFKKLLPLIAIVLVSACSAGSHHGGMQPCCSHCTCASAGAEQCACCSKGECKKCQGMKGQAAAASSQDEDCPACAKAKRDLEALQGGAHHGSHH